MIRCTIFLAAVVLVAPQAAAQDTQALRVYFVGNSVTDTINYRALAELAKSRGHQQVWGRHMNNVGSYVVGCTYFATLYRENPKGLPADPYKVTDPKLAEVIQDTVWKVVSTHELAGVATCDQ
jgi:hypothetical protein